jgi:hypothetical protein
MAGYTYRISRKSIAKMGSDLREILDNGGGSLVDEQVSQPRTKSIARFGIVIIDFDQRKIVQNGEASSDWTERVDESIWCVYQNLKPFLLTNHPPFLSQSHEGSSSLSVLHQYAPN